MAPDARPASHTGKVRRAARRWALLMADDPERHRPALEAWLARDPAHREAYRSLSRGLDVATESAALREVPRMAARPARRHSHRARLVLPIAAAIAAITAVPAILLRGGDHRAQAPAEPVIYAAMASADSARLVRAADGSRLTLAPHSMVVLRFDHGRRSVALRAGRVRFAVAHDPQRPFVVSAGGGTITALGTVFEVEGGSAVRVRLFEGSVEVAEPAKAGRQRARHVRLAPGGSTEFSPGSVSQEPVVGRTGALRLSFDNVPLGAVLDELNRNSATRVELADPSLATRRVFLDVGTGDTTSIAARLAALLGLEQVPTSTGIVLRESSMHK